jgi:hypothetical protein
VNISVRQAGGKPGDKPAFQVGSDLTATTTYERVTRSLGLANLTPGGYVLAVQVREGGSEQAVTRVQALNILGR